MSQIALLIVSSLSIAGTLLPLHKSKHWFVRGQSNFRAAYLVLNVILIVLVSISEIVFPIKVVLCIVLAIAIFLCLRSVIPYSPMVPKKVADANSYENHEELSILIHNVYQYNDQYEQLSKMIGDHNSDVVLLLETNDDWEEGLFDIMKNYDHVIKKIQENTYGIILMSKMYLELGQINHLVSKSIPSVEIVVNKNSRDIRIIGLHPQPPIPGQVLSSVPKEKEMLAAASIVDTHADNELTVVVGDLNDVAWSAIASKFKQLTGLVDPREGRGFYSTFPAYSPIKIPLDHVFCSPSFKLIEFDTLEAIGSDHRPVLVRLKIPDKPSND